MRVLYSIWLCMVLAACGTQPLPPIQTKPVIPMVVAPEPEPMVLRRPHIQVYNSTSLQVLVEQQRATPAPDFALYAMTYDDFVKLMETLNAVGVYIDKKNAQVEFYVDYLAEINRNAK